MAAISLVSVMLVAVGGAVGSVLRYLTSVAALEWLGAAFPWGTLAVNAIGSLVIGAMAGADVEGSARLLLVTGVMVTGFASAHGFGSESFMALLHVLFGEAILICLPFTRLSHAILIPFTRAYMGSESIGVRRTCDW